MSAPLGDFELLIVDDASTDGTSETLAALAAKDPRIRVLELPTCTVMLRADRVRTLRYPTLRRSDGDSMFHCMLAAEGATFARIDEPLAFVRRDDSYDYMSRDSDRLLDARRESLRDLRCWLDARSIRTFDKLHSRAWSNQLVCEAENARGMRGVWRALSALAYRPGNRRAWTYLGLG